LLSGCPGLHILVTSRESLHLRNERRLRIPPLASAPAIELFCERAQAVDSNFELTTHNAALIAQICRRLDYLPLALELVAARVDLLAPVQILDYLEQDRLQIVGDAAIDLPAHQQTLHRAIERSYQLLDAREQALFRTLAVFAGGWNLVAAQAVTGNGNPELDHTQLTPESPTPEFIVRMSSLTNKSLIYAQRLDTEEARYYLLETIRAYAALQLQQHAETQIYAARHAGYFMAFTQREVERRFAAGQKWLENLKREYENIEVALRWLLENDPARALRLALSLHPFWENGGYQRQAGRWLQQILAANPLPSLERTYALLHSGVYAQQRSEYKAATHLLEEAHVLFAKLNHLAGMAEVLRAQGWLAADMNLGRRTVELFEESLALYRQLNDKAMMSMVLADLVHVLSDPAHDYERARAYAEESVALAQDLGQPYALAYAMRQVGVNETRSGNYAAAARAYRAALAVMRQLNSVRDLPWLLSFVGEAAWHQGDWVAAQAAWQEALQIFQEQQLDYGLMLTYHHLGQLARVQSDFHAAARYYSQSLRRCWDMQHMYMVSRCLAGQGGVALGQGDLSVAAHLLAAAFRLFDTLHPFLAAPDQADYAQLRAQVEQRMAAPEFILAWNSGQAFSAAEAVEMALHFSKV
jgi:predicted ATPase